MKVHRLYGRYKKQTDLTLCLLSNIFLLFSLLLISGTNVAYGQEFVAYDDLAWEAGQANTNITLYTTGESGLLKDYDTGIDTAVTLTIAGGGSTVTTQGSDAQSGTDAYTVFNGIVDSLGLISYDTTDLTFTFTGLDPTLIYEFVLFGNRNDPAYTDRMTTTTISDVDRFFNSSTAGADFSGPNDASVTINNGYNTTNGYVARFTYIKPGTDGDMVITVSSADSHLYANALMLKATQEPVENVPPVATNDSATTSENIPVDIDVVANDADPDGTIDAATVTVTSAPTNGAAVANGDGTVTYTPDAGFTGTDTFKYTVKDNEGATSNEATVMVVVIPEGVVFVAYNDLSWSAGQVHSNITLYTTGESGLLKDYATGIDTAVTLTIAGGGSPVPTQGSDADSGTDAYNVFNGIVSSLGLISYDTTDLTFTFTGLDPTLIYEFVLFGNRNEPTYTNRMTTTTISDVEDFTNTSTPGATFSGPTDTSVTINNGYNTTNGYVARFTDIRPDVDGDMLITVSSADGHLYANALMLRATVVTHTVTPSAGPNGSISPSTPQTVEHGETTSFTVTPNTGYHTESVSGCGGTWTGTNPYTTGSITTDCTVTATFAINTYTVTPSAGANGSIDPSTPQTVNYGATKSFTVTPDTGYHVASVSGCGGTWTGTNPYTTGPITADCTVTATFAINTYTVTPSAGANGSIDPSTPQTVNYGSTTVFTITPDYGYQIDSVTGCGGTLDGNTYTTGPITADCTVAATFAAYTGVTLLAPIDGETISSGSTYPIHWEAPPEAVNFKVEYSKDNGLTWILIEKVSNVASCNWTVPKPLGNKKGCIVRVIGYDDSNKEVGRDKAVAIVIEVVGLTYPNGGETFAAGDSPTITWETNSTKNDVPVAKVRLFYTKDGGTSWTKIVTLPENPGDPVNPGSYEWTTVPEVVKDKTKCKVKVELKDASGNVLGQDVSDDYFKIEGTVELTSPNGGETLTPGGTPWLIEWTTGAIIGVEKVKLYYTKDAGVTWNPICDPVTGKCALTGNPGSYDWEVPPVGKPKENCKVRVELIDASGNLLGRDSSDDYFTITP